MAIRNLHTLIGNTNPTSPHWDRLYYHDLTQQGLWVQTHSEIF